MVTIETYAVTAGGFYFCVFILNEFESVIMDEFGYSLN